jgi:endonuclease/exonuclease/phosphatase family metal-dependent hydrolase
VATFNIHSGRGRDGTTDLSRTAAVFDAPPDIAGLNEVRGTICEGWYPDQAAQLGQLLQLESAFIPTERRWWHDHFGNALLTRLPIQQVQRIPLVGTRGKAFRCAVLARFEFQQRTVQLLAVHVDSQSDREHQLRAVISLFLGLQAPAILIGDLNSAPDDSQLRDLVARPDVTDALRDVPGRHIDWILARGFRCHSGRLIENTGSDHPAAIAELELIE